MNQTVKQIGTIALGVILGTAGMIYVGQYFVNQAAINNRVLIIDNYLGQAQQEAMKKAQANIVPSEQVQVKK